MSSLFGWSLPPGVKTLPGEEPEEPCRICGLPADQCQCPECPECGEAGCVEHLPDDVLVAMVSDLSWRLDLLIKQVKARDAKLAPYTCWICGHKTPRSILQKDPPYCPACGRFDYEQRPTEEEAAAIRRLSCECSYCHTRSNQPPGDLCHACSRGIMRRYVRTKPDLRIRHGDDFAGDAWLDLHTNKITYTAVGGDPNRRKS